MRKSPKFLRFWQQKKITCVGSYRLDKFRKLNSLNCVDVFCYFLWKMAYCIWWNMEIACDSQRKANTKYKSYDFFWVFKSALKKFHIVPFCTFAYKIFSYWKVFHISIFKGNIILMSSCREGLYFLYDESDFPSWRYAYTNFIDMALKHRVN